MGRCRLRRGYSLEVIVEEDPGFSSSALNSLDLLCNSQAITDEELPNRIDFGHYKNENEEDNEDEELKRLFNNNCEPFESDVTQSESEQQDQFNGHLNSEEDETSCKSLDEFLYNSDMDSCYIEWDADVVSSGSLLPKNEAIIGNTKTTTTTTTTSEFFSPIEDSMPENSQFNSRIATNNNNGRRSRVSRRQIVEANWLIDEADDDDEQENDEITDPFISPPLPNANNNYNDDDGELKLLLLTNNTCTTPSTILVPKFIPTPVSSSTSYSDDLTTKELFDFDSFPQDTYPSMNNCSTDETFATVETFDLNSTVSTQSPTSTTFTDTCNSFRSHLDGWNDKSNNTGTHLVPIQITHANGSGRSNDSLVNSEDSSASSVCSESSPITKPVTTASSPELVEKANGRMDSPIEVEITTDVKRVRALFENSSPDHSHNSYWKRTSLQRKIHNRTTSGEQNGVIYSSSSNSSVNGGSDLNLSRRSSNASSPMIRSAYSQLHLHQMEKYDLVDLLVNDKIIIEDSPDLFQKQRSKFQETGKCKKATNPSSLNNSSNNYASLRRSKSLGAGLHSLESDEDMNCSSASSNEDVMKSRPCILAEELPAPDTVKNVRTVFEKMVRRIKSEKTEDAAVAITNQQQHQQSGNNNPKTPNNQIKKALSCIKSNPTSKIFRSESMRDDPSKANNCNGPRFGKPVLLNSYSNSLLVKAKTEGGNPASQERTKKNVIEDGTSSPKNGIKRTTITSFKNNENKVFEMKRERNHQKRGFDRKGSADVSAYEKEDEEPNSFLSIESNSSTVGGDDNDETRLISPEVMNRIRSCGTSTTYFGGEIVAKTVKNRNLVFPQQKSIADSDNHNYTISEPIEIAIAPSSNEIFFSVRPNQKENQHVNRTNRYQDQSKTSPNHNNNGIDFASFRFMDIEGERLRKFDDEDIPRIISVQPKSQPNSPTKSNSPTTMTSSIIAEGRNSPEGCESTCSSTSGVESSSSRTENWVNSTERRKVEDSNNNCIKSTASKAQTAESTSSAAESNNSCEENENSSKKFSEAAEGAWF